MSKTKMTGIEIPKVNKKAKRHVTLYMESNGEGSQGGNIPQPSEENVGKILTVIQDANDEYVYSLEEPEVDEQDITNLRTDVVGSMVNSNNILWNSTPAGSKPTFTQIAPHIFEASGTASALGLSYTVSGNSIDGVAQLNSIFEANDGNKPKLKYVGMGFNPIFTTSNQVISMELKGGGTSNYARLYGFCYGKYHRITMNGSNSYRWCGIIDFGYYRLVFSWSGSSTISSNTTIKLQIVCTGIV